MNNAHEIWLRAKSIIAVHHGSSEGNHLTIKLAEDIIRLLDLGVDGEPKHNPIMDRHTTITGYASCYNVDKPIVGNS